MEDKDDRLEGHPDPELLAEMLRADALRITGKELEAITGVNYQTTRNWRRGANAHFQIRKKFLEDLRAHIEEVKKAYALV